MLGRGELRIALADAGAASGSRRRRRSTRRRRRPVRRTTARACGRATRTGSSRSRSSNMRLHGRVDLRELGIEVLLLRQILGPAHAHDAVAPRIADRRRHRCLPRSARLPPASTRRSCDRSRAACRAGLLHADRWRRCVRLPAVRTSPAAGPSRKPVRGSCGPCRSRSCTAASDSCPRRCRRGQWSRHAHRAGNRACLDVGRLDAPRPSPLSRLTRYTASFGMLFIVPSRPRQPCARSRDLLRWAPAGSSARCCRGCLRVMHQQRGSRPSRATARRCGRIRCAGPATMTGHGRGHQIARMAGAADEVVRPLLIRPADAAQVVLGRRRERPFDLARIDVDDAERSQLAIGFGGAVFIAHRAARRVCRRATAPRQPMAGNRP